jgi:hypothetical protein
MQHGASHHSRSMLVLSPLPPLSLSFSSDFITTWHLLVAEVRAYMHIPSLGKLLRACACVPCVNGKDTLQGCVSQQ